jgi:hypothetical protein
VRVTLLAIVALAAAVLAGCGSSNDQTASLNGETVTVPSDVHGFYGELEAILAQFPYQDWYAKCVVSTTKESLSPAEAEKLSDLPEGKREAKEEAIISKAGPECEKSSKRPVIDPNATEQQIALYRAGYITPLREIAESDKFGEKGLACVEEAVEALPAKKVITLGNGARKAREAILVSILTPCASSE